MKSTFSTKEETEDWESRASAKVDVRELVTAGTVGQHLSVPVGKPAPLRLPLDDENLLKSYHGNLKLMKLEEEILAQFAVNYFVETVCARCLKTFERSGRLEFENHYWFDRQKESPENEVVDKNFEIEVGKPIYEEIYFDIPMKPLCDKACKGLR